jgi:putative endopeptidase
MTNMFTLAGDAPDTAKAEADAVLRVETKLAQGTVEQVDLRDPKSTYHIEDKAQLAQMTPNFDWSRYFANMGRPDLTSINVATPSFFQTLNGVLQDQPMDDLKAYMKWQVLDGMAGALPTKFGDAVFAYNSTQSGIKEPPPRWERIVSSVDSHLSDALGQKFVAEKFPPEAKAAAKSMINNIIAAAREKIDSNTWMSETTKKAALDKIDHLTVKVGYPDKWDDYSQLNITKGPFAANILAARRFEQKEDLAKIGKPADPTEWGMSAPTVNAYYNAQHNEIVFPAGILQPPLFDFRADTATNYGAIGSVMGHELTHGFDDSGAQYDAQGRLNNWWDPADYKHFTALADAVANQMSQYEFDGQHEDGKLVEGEAIADLGGLELAWDAYKQADTQHPSTIKDGFTSDQRFWLSHGLCWAENDRPQVAHMLMDDEHPLSQFRNAAPMSDMAEFYQAFNVQPGDKLYRPPAERCHLWDDAPKA